jgi:ribosomal protein L37E
MSRAGAERPSPRRRETWTKTEREIAMVFDSISKATRVQAQRCNVCGQVSRMKDTNVCKKCWPKIFGRALGLRYPTVKESRS